MAVFVSHWQDRGDVAADRTTAITRLDLLVLSLAMVDHEARYARCLATPSVVPLAAGSPWVWRPLISLPPLSACGFDRAEELA